MFQKYVTALELMDVIIAETQKVQDVQSSKENRQATNIAWDALYTFVHANFVCPQTVLKTDSVYTEENKDEFESEVEEMVVMFGKDRATLEDELRKIPPVIAEVAFPVYIARYLLRYTRVAISPLELTTFDEFHKRYAYMIINGSKKYHK